MEPRRIASYTLLEPIGHGGMAVVYRARQESLDRIVAVKVLSENLARSEEFIERFRREARTAANMRHPNVITVHDYGQDDNGVPYLVLEFVEGETLADLMDYGLDDVRVPDLLDQVAAGLDYAHSRGVIHRDVKRAPPRTCGIRTSSPSMTLDRTTTACPTWSSSSSRAPHSPT